MKQNGSYGIIDKMGGVLLPVEYSKVQLTDDGKLLQLTTDDAVTYMPKTEVLK